MTRKGYLEINKFDISNFALRPLILIQMRDVLIQRSQIRDVLIQRSQLRPLSGKAKRLEGMTNDDWKELN